MLEYICLLVYLETIVLVWTSWLLHVGTQQLKILVYPDVKWALDFRFG
jgi:hypothetical protein